MKHIFIIKGLEKEEGIIKYGEVVNLIEDLLNQLTKPIKLKSQRFDTKLVIKVKSKKQTKEYDMAVSQLKELFDKW